MSEENPKPGKGLAIAILEKADKEREESEIPEEDTQEAALRDASSEAFEAVKNNDSEGFYIALRSFVDILKP